MNAFARLAIRCLLSGVVVILVPDSALAQSWVKVVQPAGGLFVNPGSRLIVAADASPDVTSVAVQLSGLGRMVVSGARPFSLVLNVPRDALGIHSILISGITAKGGVVDGAPVSIKIGEITAEIGKLSSQFETIDFDFPGARTALSVYYAGTQGGSRQVNGDLIKWRSEPDGYISVVGGYVYGLRAGDASLILTDGISSLGIPVTTRSASRGDLNGDGQIDERDLAAFRIQPLNVRAVGPEDARDLNRDGNINALDLRVLTTLCSRPRCAAQ